MAGDAMEPLAGPINISTDERIASAIGGALLILPALLQPSRGRLALAIAGAALLQRGGIGHCMLYQAWGISTADGAGRKGARRDPVTRTSEDSFPASDPPSWTPVKGPVSEHRPAKA
jgi:hypothetical protein